MEFSYTPSWSYRSSFQALKGSREAAAAAVIRRLSFFGGGGGGERPPCHPGRVREWETIQLRLVLSAVQRRGLCVSWAFLFTVSSSVPVLSFIMVKWSLL